jgi:hypothetical protein
MYPGLHVSLKLLRIMQDAAHAYSKGQQPDTAGMGWNTKEHTPTLNLLHAYRNQTNTKYGNNHPISREFLFVNLKFSIDEAINN